MGSCFAKNKAKTDTIIKKESNDINKAKKSKQNQKRTKNYGMVDYPGQKCVRFNHSPLRYCDFLFSKFKKSDSTPEEVCLGFMLNGCEIDREKGEISLCVINGSLIKVWVIYGGVEKISETGLTVAIQNYSHLQQIFIEKPSSNTGVGDKLPKVRFSQHLHEQILIILEPLLSCNEAMFMIYRFQIAPNEKEYSLITQTLEWNSLSFRISDIYGSEYLFKLNDENENCSVCLTNKSECILLPCRHMCVCPSCLQVIQKVKPNCPLCRKQYYSVVKYVQKQSSESIVIT